MMADLRAVVSSTTWTLKRILQWSALGSGVGALVGVIFEALKWIVDPPTVPPGAPPALIAIVPVLSISALGAGLFAAAGVQAYALQHIPNRFRPVGRLFRSVGRVAGIGLSLGALAAALILLAYLLLHEGRYAAQYGIDEWLIRRSLLIGMVTIIGALVTGLSIAMTAAMVAVLIKATPSTWLGRLRKHRLTPYLLLSLIVGVVLCWLLAESVYGYRQYSGDRALFVCAGTILTVMVSFLPAAYFTARR